MCRLKTAFFSRKAHFSERKCVFLHENAFFFFSVGEPIFCRKVHFSAVYSGGLRIMNCSLFLDELRSLVAHDCGYPLSRYTCRATRVAADFPDFIAFCRCSSGVALHPLKILVSHLPPLCQEVSHRNLGLKRCRAARGCRSYSCGCRTTLCQLS